jgi:hypothetical protein
MKLFLSCIAALALSAAAHGAFQLTTVDSGATDSYNSGGQIGAAMDRSNSPAVCFWRASTMIESKLWRSGLYYYYKNGATWNWEVVDTGATGAAAFAALAFDANNYPHIGYRAGGYPFRVRHAWKDATGWHSEQVDARPGTPSIAIDNSNNVHLAYWNSNTTTKRPLYAKKSGDTWTIDSSMYETKLNSEARITVDAAGLPQILCNTIRYRNTGSVWIADTLQSGAESDIFAGTAGKVYITSRQITGGTPDVFFDYYDGSAWQHTVVDTNGWRTHGALDAQGNAHIMYSMYAYSGNTPLKYATNRTGAWVVEQLDTNLSCTFAGATADANGNAHLFVLSKNPLGGFSGGKYSVRYYTNAGVGINDRPRILASADIDAHQPMCVSLFDQQGRCLRAGTCRLQDAAALCDGLAAGVYFLRLENGAARKMIVVR